MNKIVTKENKLSRLYKQIDIIIGSHKITIKDVFTIVPSPSEEEK